MEGVTLHALRRGELELLLEDLDQRDDVVVALARHGVKYKDGQKSSFSPIAPNVSKRENLIAPDDIHAMLCDSRAGRKLLLCDACRNDPLRGGSRTPQIATRREAPPPSGGVAALYGCSGGKPAWEHEDLGHGLFFHFVLEGVRGRADPDGAFLLQRVAVKSARARLARPNVDLGPQPGRAKCVRPTRLPDSLDS